ncbi:MAG: PAS domain S-box protein, partial [Arenimonas sp.]|uniref:PAS domain-containing protein n=1 Tax=Arenimonas sp. TaxID=1872635 RepID=UPI0025BE2D72
MDHDNPTSNAAHGASADVRRSRDNPTVARLEALINTGGAGADPVFLSEILACLHGLQREADSVRRRYQSLFNAVPDPISIIDADGRIVDLNRAGEKAYQRQRSELIGKFVHAINPDLPANHMLPVLEALARDETYVIEVNNTRGDGSLFPVEVHSASFHDGPHRHVIAVARDLSRRQEAELNYHALLVAIDKGVLFQGFDGRVLSANPAAYRLLGLDEGLDVAASLRFDDWMVIDHRGYPMRFRDLPPLKALASGKIVESTLLGLYHHRRKQLTWVSATSVPQFHAGSSKPH